MILEACVGNLKDAISAQLKGAHQIELCDRLDLDGNSPPFDLIEKVTSSLEIPVKVIVNPKPYDYSYNRDELEAIENYIKSISKLNISGIVFGPVDKERMPDLKAIKQISECSDLPITFHKSIDDSPNIINAISSLIDQGIIRYILSSGGAETAKEGIKMLKKMKNTINNQKSDIELIGAGSITEGNLSLLDEALNLNYYHGKLIVGNL